MMIFSDRRLPISLLVSKALLIAKVMSESAFNIKSAFDSKSAFRYHFWMQKCKIGAFGEGPGAKRASAFPSTKAVVADFPGLVWETSVANNASLLVRRSFLTFSSLAACNLHNLSPPLVTLDSALQPSTTQVFLLAWFSYRARWWLQA